jgi:chromosome segregation ATPase
MPCHCTHRLPPPRHRLFACRALLRTRHSRLALLAYASPPPPQSPATALSQRVDASSFVGAAGPAAAPRTSSSPPASTADRGLAAQLRGEQRRADALEADLRAACDELARERASAGAAAAEVASLRSRAAAPNGGLAAVATEAEKLARAELEHRLAHAAAEIAALNAAVSELRSANDLLTEQKNSRDRIAARSREELQRARADYEAAVADKGRMIARIEMLQAERDDQAAAMDELSRAVEAQGELVDAVERLEKERGEAVAAARQLEQSLGSAIKRVAELEGAEDAAADAASKLERERGEAIAAWEELADQLESSRRRVGELESAVGRLERELSAERGARESAQRAVERAEEARAALAAGVDRSSTAHNELVEKVRSDAEIIARATTQNTELKSRLFELEDR